MAWPSNEAKSISENFMYCSQYINQNVGVITHPDSITPSIYLWDLVNLFSPYIKESETGKDKEKWMSYPG